MGGIGHSSVNAESTEVWIFDLNQGVRWIGMLKRIAREIRAILEAERDSELRQDHKTW